MPTYQTEDVTYCHLDGRLFFLDVKEDRYFQLPTRLEQRFRSSIVTPETGDISGIFGLTQDLSSPAERAPSARPAGQLLPPQKSVLETPGYRGKISLGTIRDVFIAVVVTHQRLKRQRLKLVLDSLSEYRRLATQTTDGIRDKSSIEQRVAEAAAVFNHVRPYVPIETRCLLDSISLVRYLASVSFPVDLVMGVACDPFSAHAWVQRGDVVLNDTVGNVLAYKPIRVI